MSGFSVFAAVAAAVLLTIVGLAFAGYVGQLLL